MTIRFQEIVSRITSALAPFSGVSIPVFGVSWTPPEPDRNIVRRVLARLEDRRALYYPYDLENPNWVEQSIIEIRRDLSDALGEVSEESVASEAFAVMRRACREFLDEAQDARYGAIRPFEDYFMALGKMRYVVGIQVARLSVAYGIDVEDELSSILPQPVAEDSE
jgi:hypothetical protein